MENIYFSSNSFLPLTAAFDGTPISLANALKVKFVPMTAVKRAEDKTVSQTFDVAALTDKALIDFSSVNIEELDFYKMQQDCELLKTALKHSPDEIKQALKMVCSGTATRDDIDETGAALRKAGLTEQAFREQGGGMIGLIVAVVAVMLAAGCEGCKGCQTLFPKPNLNPTKDQ